MLNDNPHFQSAVQKYKHVVTNVLGSNIEVSYKVIMKNLHNVVCLMITKTL